MAKSQATANTKQGETKKHGTKTWPYFNGKMFVYICFSFRIISSKKSFVITIWVAEAKPNNTAPTTALSEDDIKIVA